MNAEFLEALRPEWDTAESLVVGKYAPGREPAARVGVTVDGAPKLRVDIFIDCETLTFADVLCIAPVAAIGYGEHVYFVNAPTREVKSLPLSGYFGAIYTAKKLGLRDNPFDFLVTSADSLLRFASDGSLLWRAGGLGIDGVRVEDVEGGRIVGSGELDPPGGWKSFVLDLNTGQQIA